MFKRKHDYLMEMDVEVNYAPVEQFASARGLDFTDAKELGLESLVKHIERAAKEVVNETGQKLRSVESDPSGECPRLPSGSRAIPSGRALRLICGSPRSTR